MGPPGERTDECNSASRRSALFVLLFLCFLATISLWNNNNISNPPEEVKTSQYQYPSVIFGHLHIAKTAGSEINSILSLQYERVCGNKGYSLSAYRANQRKQQKIDQLEGEEEEKVKVEEQSVQAMKKWGYEDCDYISLETGWGGNTWEFWKIQAQHFWEIGNITMELHIPCRDPLEHLMSQCNMMNHQFDCDNMDMEQEYRKCVPKEWEDRFNTQLTDGDLPHLVVKCFNPIPLDPYLQYMGQILQLRRISENHIHGNSNKPRSKTNECIWNDKPWQEDWKDFLLTRPYYRYCHMCLGSTDDLLFRRKI